MTQKTTSHNARNVTRDNFLGALYPNVPDKLWLELRCIHPETGEVRSFWTQSDHDQQREAICKQTDKLRFQKRHITRNKKNLIISRRF